MTVDFSKFAFTGIENPRAATLTDAVTVEPVNNGYIVVTLKTQGGAGFAEPVRRFAQALRAGASSSGLTDITAYREARTDELGGGIPFDQAICDRVFADARRRHEAEPDKWPMAGMAVQLTQENGMADWILLVEYGTADQAEIAAADWKKGDGPFAALTDGVGAHTVNVFKNTKGYASVSRDPNLVQFFNLFPGPGDVSTLWDAWQEALPYFLEIGEFRSSFPLVALDPDQPILVVNYAHCDSVKHFFLAVAYDPNFLETVTRCYADRGFHLPLPFFCKIVPM